MDAMFGPEAPPLDWDRQRLYSRQNIELYYLSHAATPLSKENIVEVRQDRQVFMRGGLQDG